MRAFDYVHLPETLLTPEISSLLSSIHEYRGKQDLYIEAKRDVLDALVEVAMIQSTDASNRIEGIFTSDIRLKQLVEETKRKSPDIVMSSRQFMRISISFP